MQARARVPILVAAVLLLAVGCGSGSESTDSPPGQVVHTRDSTPATSAAQNDFGNATVQPSGPSAPSPPSMGTANPPGSASGTLASEFLADAGNGWLTLLEADWKLAANSETNLCARATVPRDAYFHEFSPVIPLGTHHTVLTVDQSPSSTDGVVPCGSPDLSGHQIYGAGVGSKDYALPDGVAMRVRAGEQLVMNLHLFNASSEPLTGRSGVLVHTLDEADVENVAQGVLAGPIQLQIPPGHVTQSGQCTLPKDATLFSVGPHMHQLGVHMKIVAQSSVAGSTMLFDGPYSFDSQQRYPVEFLPLKAGDAVHVECTYENTTDRTVSFGQSTRDEMCFAALILFPAQDAISYLCTN
jgi:hypothetical protein